MSALKGLRILVAEDDGTLLRILVKFLVSRGSIVTEALDGKIAWDLLQSQNFDLVLSDIQMPNLTGTELLTKVRKVDPKIPVFLFVTGQAQLDEAEALSAGAAGLIQKPFKFDFLVGKIEELVAGGSLELKDRL